MSNNLIIKDGSKINNEFKELLDKSISREVLIDGNFYDMYTLDPPQSFSQDLGKSKSEVKYEFSQSNFSDIKYLQSICKKYVSLAKIELEKVLPKDNTYVNNFIKVLDDIENDNFDEEFYDKFIDLVKNVNDINYKKNINITLLNFLHGVIINIEKKNDNLYDLLSDLIYCHLIISIKLVDNKFKINISEKILTLIRIFYHEDYIDKFVKTNDKKNIPNIIIRNQDFIKDYDFDKGRCANPPDNKSSCMDTCKKIINYIDKGYNNLNDIIFQSGILHNFLNKILACGLILINKEKLYKNFYTLYGMQYFICCYIPDIVRTTICYYEDKNGIIILNAYMKYCDYADGCKTDIDQDNLLKDNKYFHIKYSFDPELTYIDFTFENNVDISAEDKQILGEKYPHILEYYNSKYLANYYQNYVFKFKNITEENYDFPINVQLFYENVPGKKQNKSNKKLSSNLEKIMKIMFGGVLGYILYYEQYNKKEISQENNKNILEIISNFQNSQNVDINKKYDFKKIYDKVLHGALIETDKCTNIKNYKTAVLPKSDKEKDKVPCREELKQYFVKIIDEKKTNEKLIELGIKLYEKSNKPLESHYQPLPSQKNILVLCADDTTCQDKKSKNLIEKLRIMESKLNEKYYYIGDKLTIKGDNICKNSIKNIDNCNNFPEKYYIIVNESCPVAAAITIYDKIFYNNILKKLDNSGSYIYKKLNGKDKNPYSYNKDDNEIIKVNNKNLFPDEYFTTETKNIDNKNYGIVKLKDNLDINDVADKIVKKLEKRSVKINTAPATLKSSTSNLSAPKSAAAKPAAKSVTKPAVKSVSNSGLVKKQVKHVGKFTAINIPKNKTKEEQNYENLKELIKSKVFSNKNNILYLLGHAQAVADPNKDKTNTEIISEFISKYLNQNTITKKETMEALLAAEKIFKRIMSEQQGGRRKPTDDIKKSGGRRKATRINRTQWRRKR